jgi:hypothetical protein
MYSPAFVFPYHSDPGQWYTWLAVFTHTCPAAPGGGGAAACVLGGGAVGVLGVVAGAPGAVVAVAGVVAGDAPGVVQACTP